MVNGNWHPTLWLGRLRLVVLALALVVVGGCGWGTPIGLGPDAIALGDNVTQVREKMGGQGRNDPGDYETTDGAHVTEFYWNYDDVRVHFNMQTVVEIFRRDPELGIWVRTQPPPATSQDDKPVVRPQPTPPTRTVPGMHNRTP